MGTEKYKKGTTVFWEGDPGNCMYYIRWGTVGVYVNYATIHQKKLAELTSGDYFGEMGLIDGAPRSATVEVLESGTLIDRIGKDEFAQFLAENPNKVYAIIQQLSHKLRDATNTYLDACRSVANAVGDDSVDETSDYRFGQDERLQAIHDVHAATIAEE